MGDGFCIPDILPKYIIDYDELFKIKDFLLLMKVIEYLEKKILELKYKEVTIFHLCTIVYEEEDLKRIKGINRGLK